MKCLLNWSAIEIMKQFEWDVKSISVYIQITFAFILKILHAIITSSRINLFTNIPCTYCIKAISNQILKSKTNNTRRSSRTKVMAPYKKRKRALSTFICFL